MKELKAWQLEDGMILVLPHNKTATVKSVNVGTKFVTFESEHGRSRLELDYPVMIEDYNQINEYLTSIISGVEQLKPHVALINEYSDLLHELRQADTIIWEMVQHLDEMKKAKSSKTD